ncbi:MAG: hypothetical protein J7K98_03625 [Candidatus Aenigmarchaeota archaeon]|nr:hypothetical protein [Candidatus Aenigmarchaeota archaeon]
MPSITLFIVTPKPNSIVEVIQKLHEKKIDDGWFIAKQSNYVKDEVEVSYFFYETLEDNLRKVINTDDLHEITSILMKNGNFLILRKVICFLNVKYGLLEVYRGLDDVTKRVKESMEKLLDVKLEIVKLDSNSLKSIIDNHTEEVRQAMFKNVDGFWYTVLRGTKLEVNPKFKAYLAKNHNSLRVISIRPRIRYLNGKRYTVTINGDRGTLRFSYVDSFKWRPRFEVRQITYIVMSALGFCK